MRHARKLSVLLAAVMAVGMAAGCGESSEIGEYSETVVATYGDTDIYLDEANFWLRYIQFTNENQYAQIYAYFGYTDMWSAPGSDGTSTMADTVHTNVMKEIHQTLVLNDHAADYNVELTDEQKQKISDNLTSFLEQNPTFTDYCDADQSKMEEWMQENATANLVAQAIKDSADVSLSEDDYKEYSVQYITVSEPEETTAEDTTAASETTAAESDASDSGESQTETTAAAESSAGSTAAESSSGDTEAESSAGTTAVTAGETTAADTTAAADETTDSAAETAADGDTTAAVDESAAESDTSAEETTAASGEDAANEVLSRAQSGEDLETIADDLNLTAQSASYLVTGETSTDDTYTNSKDMAAGEVTMYHTDGSGWTILKKVNDYDEEASDEKKQELTEEKQSDAFDEKYKEFEDAAPEFKVNDKIWSQVTISGSATTESSSADDSLTVETSESGETAADTTAAGGTTAASGTTAAASDTTAAGTSASETTASGTTAAASAESSAESAAETTAAQ